ncbi:acrosomal protein KIAA1210 homolog isoform X1 [Bufo bufo]|uniref:acrosomal protein KIAA1210 homolog isoform X1 n=2 Tax=Bufo bufo TaxID=8384 RepID=UPI001ABE6CA0|nr:acrosomal protein KIAA1210 homolog isoform X1 [Bufo bufo]
MSALYSCLKGKNDAIMAANTSEGAQTVMLEEPHEECSGKKKSKFQAFKKLFVKKKRKESTAPIKESNLKPSQSSSDVSGSGANTTAFDADQESVSKGNMGSKAVSHDSVFISEMESSVKEDISQECTPGKVKALQLQLQQNIRIGSPPQGIVPKKLEDSGTLSEDDGLPRSPPEITSLHEILARSSGKSPNSAQRRNSISLGGTDSEDEPESSELSSRPTSPSHSNVLLCPTSPVSHFPLADFTSPASSVSCLDNSAAKHKILVKPKKRRPPIMNVKPTQGTNRTNKPVQIKRGEENDNMVEEQLFEIPDLDKCSVHEASSEVVKIAEDVLQKPEEDIVVSVCEPQMDVSKKDNTPLILEVPLLENQIVSFQNEAVCSETDVDFNETLVSIGDRVDIAEELESDEVTTSPQTYDFQPTHENNEITITVIPSEISSVETPEGNTVQIENPNLNTSQDLVCGSIGNYEPNLEEAVATAVSVISHEEYNELGTVLPDIQNDLLNVSKSDLVETDTLENRMLSIQTVTSMIKDDVQEVQVACECDRSHESNEKHLDTVEIQNTEAILEVSDQLVANNEGKNEQLPSEQKTETSDLSITEVKDDQCDVDNVPDSKAPVITNANDSSYTKVTTNAHDFGIFANSETSAEIVKEIKSAEPIPDSNIKGSNKPIRFTVAPAWQRVHSSGSSVKDSPFIKNAIGNIVRSGSLDSADESVVQSSSEKKNVQKDQEESCGHFGVRLRRTSSSIKYNEDHQEDFSTEDLSPVDSSSLLPGKSLQTPKRTTFNIDCAKMSSNDEEKVTPEVRSQPKPKADHSPPENTEPAWITMAKLKQKGFQEHPLAREQSSATEKNEKVKETECIQKKYIVTSPQVVEEKRSEQAAADSPAAPEVAQPDSEKSTPSTQPQNPEEPPWFVLAKKKAKAWSEMPKIVQQ